MTDQVKVASRLENLGQSPSKDPNLPPFMQHDRPSLPRLIRRDMEFRSTVAAAHWDEAANQWNVTLEGGRRAASRFLFTAIGILSAYTLPAIPGRDSFTGPAYHPARWPH